MATLEINQQEAEALLKFIDIGVRNSGLNSAEAGVHLAKKIHQALSVVSATNTGAVANEGESEEDDAD